MRIHSCFVQVLSVLLANVLFAGDSPSVKPERAKLIGHWKLNGDIQDSSGNGLHAQNHGVKFVADRTGPLPGSASFGGRGEFLLIPHSELLNFGTDDFTISMWLHTEKELDDDIGDLISKFDPKTRTGFQLSVRNNTGVTSSSPNARQLQFGIDQGSEPTWTDLGRPGGENSILPFAMADFQGKLWAGTCEPGTNAKGDVYFRQNERDWQKLSVPHLANSVSSFAIYKGDLFAGTAKYRVAGSALAESENANLGGQVFRLSQGQDRWISCGRLPDTEAIGGMTVFKGQLYASSLYKPAGFFRYEGGEKWTSLPTPNGKRTESLGVYNGYLWATGYDQGNVYRFDGEAWTDLGQLGDNTQTYSFAIHEGRLCVGTWPSGKVFRLSADDKWEDMGRLGQELEVMGMLVHNGKLYAGTLPLAEVYRYDGGQTWTRVKQLDTTENVKYRRVWTMTQYQGKLACGVLPTGRVHAMQTGACATSHFATPPGSHHITAIKSGQVIQILLDGRVISESEQFDHSRFNLSSEAPLKIGAGPGDTFYGRISDVRIYRGALTRAEVSQMSRERLARLPVQQIIAHRGASAEFPENTLVSAYGALDANATCLELDVRRTKDGVLVPFHDATVDRTTNGKGPVNQMTWPEIAKLDVGGWKDSRFSEMQPTPVADILFFMHRLPDKVPGTPKIKILLDLKEDGNDFLEQVATTVKEKGDPTHTIIGVRTVEQARIFRKLLPQARQLGLISDPKEIEIFCTAGVEMIRLWPKWLVDETLVPQIRKAGAKLHLNGITGLPDEIRPLMKFQPDSLSSDNPEQLIETLLNL